MFVKRAGVYKKKEKKRLIRLEVSRVLTVGTTGFVFVLIPKTGQPGLRAHNSSCVTFTLFHVVKYEHEKTINNNKLSRRNGDFNRRYVFSALKSRELSNIRFTITFIAYKRVFMVCIMCKSYFYSQKSHSIRVL